MIDFLVNVFMITVSQLVMVLGVVFVFGLVLHFFQKASSYLMMRAFGWGAVYWTGWIGTPVHELGHALFCLIFLHKITDIKFFDPEPSTGTLGYVNHSYNRKNLYHRIGNFFIGVGPLILSPVVIFLGMLWLVPNSDQIFTYVQLGGHNIINQAGFVNQVYQMGYLAKDILFLLFTRSNLNVFGFWVFIYIAIAISSHMGLSPSDIKGMWSGFVVLFLVLLGINFGSLLMGWDVSQYLGYVTARQGFVAGLFILATILSFVNLIFSAVVSFVFSFFK